MSVTGKNIIYNVSITLPDSSYYTQQNTIVSEVIDEAIITIPSGSEEIEVDINPSLSISDVQGLLILASNYPIGLSYKIADSGNPSIEFKNDHIYIGGQLQAVNLLPNKIFITNNSLVSITFTIITLRKI
jgi:hypothetical protein